MTFMEGHKADDLALGNKRKCLTTKNTHVKYETLSLTTQKYNVPCFCNFIILVIN